MKKIIALLICIYPFIAFSQLTLRYKSCTGCPTTNVTMPGPATGFDYQYAATIQTMTPMVIASDYGRRGVGSLWHMGVDYGPEGGDADAGDAIYPIETGTITALKGTGYKRIAIRGTHRFAYGHIFFEGVPGAGGMRSGNFILKKMNGMQSNFYAIIYFSGNAAVAYGEMGGTVSHPSINGGSPITVLTEVTSIDSPIAPIGDSGSDGSGFDAHIHLYNFQNDPTETDFGSSYPASYNVTYFRNAKNPLEFLQDQNNLPIYNITFPNTNLVYPGTARSSFRVRAAMFGQAGGGDYTDAMDIDAVELFLKKKSESFSSFQYYKGSVLESKILYGGRLNNNRYPSFSHPPHNTGANAIDIAKGDQVGSLTQTGIDPFAYATQPYDEFYFSDFFSRIHKNDNYGGTNATFASINSDARYSDGEYDYYVRLTTADDHSHISGFQTLTLDNFRPYIKEVIVRKENESGALVYRGFWDWNGSQLTSYRENYSDAGPSDNIWIKIVASEPLKATVAHPIAINIPAVDGTSYRSMNVVAGTNEMEFFIVYPPIATPGNNAINLVGWDYGDNHIEAMGTSPITNPVRLANNNWSSTPSPGIDNNHHFNTGTGSCAPPPGGGRTKSSECLIANFNSNVRETLPGSPVTFTSLSTGEGTLQYTWNFGAGASPASATTVGPHSVSYSSVGNKTVSLTVTDANGTVTQAKTNYIFVSQTSSSANFTASATSGTLPHVVTFSPVYSGTVNTYNWSFPGGSPSTSSASNPVVTYLGAGSYDVTLTVNGATTINKPGYIIVNASSAISAAIIYCDNYYFTNCNNSFKQHDGIYFSASVSGGTPFYSYAWNFGDGGTSSSVEPLYSYSSAGIFTVTLTVTDSKGVTATTTTSVSVASVIPEIVALWNSSDSYIGPGDGPVTFTNASTSNIDLTYAQYYWDFGEGAFPRYAYTKGPHQVCYSDINPSKTVYLRVHDPVTNTTDDLLASNHIYVAKGNVGQCHTTAPRWESTPGAASGGAVQTCLYPNEIVGIKNGQLSSLTCVHNTYTKECAFSASEPCFADTWYGSHGDPSLRREHTNGYPNMKLRLWSGAWYDPDPAVADGVSSEGIFYQHPENFKAGKRYTFTFYANVPFEDNEPSDYPKSIDHFRISLTNGLLPYNCASNASPAVSYALPTYAFSLHQLGSFEYALNTGAWKCYEVYFYPPTNNFNQIWMYPAMEGNLLSRELYNTRQGRLLIDDFSLRVDQNDYMCPPDIVVDNTNPANLIGAALSVKTSGTVTVSPGQSKVYRSGQVIVLRPGFSALTGSTFSAFIGDCTSSAGRAKSLPDSKQEYDIYKQDYLQISTQGLEEREPRDEDENRDNFVEIFPNPASGKIMIRYNDPSVPELRISIVDMLGNEIFRQDNLSGMEITVDVSQFSSGMYIIKVESPHGVYYERLVKQ